MKQLLLNPNDADKLKSCYEKAATNSTDLLIATAFLTEWPINVELKNQCKNILVLVGTDFGLTRKKALHNLLKWIPPDKRSNVLAVPSSIEGSFHPKIIAWREKNGKHYTLIGSSNLTVAAFDKNYEVNIHQEISSEEFAAIKQWLRNIATNSQVITSDWIKFYKESDKNKFRSSKKKPKNNGHVIDLEIKILKKHKKELEVRRSQQASFSEIKPNLLRLLKNSEDGKLSNTMFWKKFWSLWSKHHSRLQGSGIQFSGKKANWKQASSSLLKVIKNLSEK